GGGKGWGGTTARTRALGGGAPGRGSAPPRGGGVSGKKNRGRERGGTNEGRGRAPGVGRAHVSTAGGPAQGRRAPVRGGRARGMRAAVEGAAMNTAAPRLFGRLVAIQLAVLLATGFIVVQFARPLLLLDATVLRGTVGGAFWAAVLMGAYMVGLTFLIMRPVR